MTDTTLTTTGHPVTVRGSWIAPRVTCRRPFPHRCQLERCDMCGQDLPHDFVHWNGAFLQCAVCTRLEDADDTQSGLDPITGLATFGQGNTPIYSHLYVIDQGVRIDPEIDAFGVDYATVLGLLEDGKDADAEGTGPLYLVNIGNVFHEAYEYVIPESRIREAIPETDPTGGVPF